MNNLLVATQHGLAICERVEEEWREVARGLVEQNVTSVIAREGVILAGTTDGIFRSDDAGQSWREANSGLSSRHVRWLAYHPDISDREFAGTEPAGIFVSHDGGGAWRACPEVAQLRDEHKWSLPYSPEAGCVRGFAFLGSRGYAAVEVGGVLSTDDSGESWKLVEGSDGNPDLEGPPEPLVSPDVHSISVHAWSRDGVFAPTGGGFYRSTDGGKTWALVYDCYCRAAWVDPNDPQHIILGPADGVDRDGRIEATNDGGQTWVMASAGLQVPWRRGMVERFTQAQDELLAVLSNGELLATKLSALEWRRVLPAITGINAVFEAVS
ncbi:MAG: WD40/YVTN/BNR-like repeat-containing protein [Anaerolineales bacterium]